MRWDKVLLVFSKDWKEIRRNWEVLAPVIILPLLISIVLPAAITVIPSDSSNDLDTLLMNIPDMVKAEIAGFNEVQATGYLLLVYVFAPLFLLIPAMASSVIASDSFAGEKERKTIEGLLATPITDTELLLGKILVAFIPAIGITILSFAAYTIVVDTLAYGIFGKAVMPTLNWILVILGLAPAVSIMGIGLSVMVSARVKGFREAQQISVLLILPIMGLLLAQVSGILLLTPIVILLITSGFYFLDVIIIILSVKIFRREEILSRMN
jgi:ABC-2 type transport system permease protein